jgi:hypothetical protein
MFLLYLEVSDHCPVEKRESDRATRRTEGRDDIFSEL